MKGPGIIHLQDPDDLSVENAYRNLPRTGEITIETSISRLTSQLESLEQVGFAGMVIKAFDSSDDRIVINACKGKQGTCYNTGRFARYLGTALAAMDDDYHLLIAGDEIPVCEKTANLYFLRSYRKHIYCSDADGGLMEKLQTDPELFDCDHFEMAQEKLYSMIQQKRPTKEYKDLFYPGPFKLLVLEDGTIVRRGRINKVPVMEARKLQKEGLFGFEGQARGEHESFNELYKAEGPRCLLRNSQHGVITNHSLVPDLSALTKVSRNLRNRMLQTIESKKNYFILTGSNREEEYGCCPSDEVTMADHLARNGILSASREPAAAGACPVTIYAFWNEITNIDGNMQFKQDRDFREEVRMRLMKSSHRLLKVLTRWALLGFVAVTVILALLRIAGSSSPFEKSGLYTRLEVSRPNCTVLVLFHYSKRCDQCLAMERYSMEVLRDDFPTMMDKEQILFRQVVMDLPENRSIIERFGLVTSTLVVIRFEERVEDSIRVLDRSWVLFNNEKEFKKMLSEELQMMIGLER